MIPNFRLRTIWQLGESANVVIDYTISDGNGGTDSAQLTVTVTGTNDGPVCGQ